MKSNEEFIEGIYSKKDALIKKRKKKISVIVTAVCAVICVAAAAGFIGADRPVADEEEAPEITKASEKVWVEEAEGYADEDCADAEIYNLVSEYPKDPAAPVTEAAMHDDNSDGNKGQSDEKIYHEGEMGISDITVPEYPAETGGDGPDTGVQGGSIIPDSNGSGKTDNLTPAEPPIAMAPPIVMTDEAVDAAYDRMTEAEKAKVSKENAEAVVSREADGTQTYTVYFELLKGGFFKVKLNSELERIS